MPALQFLSSEADDAKWLIWGKILHARGTRGSKWPDPNVLVRITETAVIVKRFPQTYYYVGNVAAPCQCRSLSIVVQHAAATPPLIWQSVLTNQYVIGSLSGPYPQERTTHYDGYFETNYGQVPWSINQHEYWPGGTGTPGIDILYTYNNAPFGGQFGVWSDIQNGAFHQYVDGEGHAITDSVATETYYQLTAGYIAAKAAYDAAFAAAGAIGNHTLILLSDGTQLASIPYTDDGAGNLTNYPAVPYWTGDSWVQLQTNAGGHWAADLRSSFGVPDDTCSPTRAGTQIVPASPVYTPVADWVALTDADYYLAYADVYPWLLTGSPPVLVDQQYPPGTRIQYGLQPTSDGIAFMIPAVAIARERARVKTCSDNLKTNLKAGVLQDQIKKVLRERHPISANAYQESLMTAAIVNGSIGSGDDITNTKTVTLTYTSVDEAGNDVINEQVVEGTQHIVITRCANSSGTPNAISYTTTTYTNWLPISTTGDSGTALDYTYQLDNRDGLAQMWNGIVVAGASSIAATFDSLGSLYVPPYPQSSDSRTYSYPALYIEYRAATARKYKVGSGNTAWRDSAFKNGETVDIFPLSVIHSELGDLGMFPQAADITDTTKLTLRADMKATYRYDYNTGVWTGSGADLADGDGNPAPITLPYQAGVNMVFRSRTTPWPDVAADSPLSPASYQGQALDIKTNPGNYPLFVPLLSV